MRYAGNSQNSAVKNSKIAKSTSDLDRAFYYNALKRLAEALQKGSESEIETWSFNAEELKKHLEAKELFKL